MFTSVTELKKRLQDFLDDPRTEEEFHGWFSDVFRNVHLSGDPVFVDLVRSVQAVFAESALGTVSGDEAFRVLENLATPTAVAVPTPKQNVLLVMPSPTSGTGVPKENNEEERFASTWYMEPLASGRR
jgi:hypothetical protein